MSLFEGILVASLCVNAWGLWRIGKIESDIEMLYEGTAMCMTKLGMTDDG